MIEEIEVFKPSCDGLPLECFGDEIQEETRKTPLCKNRGGEAITNISQYHDGYLSYKQL